MTRAAEQPLEQAMRLDPADPAELSDRLAELSDDPAYTAEWAEELQARIDSYENGEAKVTSWEEARERILRGDVGDD